MSILQMHQGRMELYFMLQHAETEGITLYLEGIRSSPEEITEQHCLHEDNVYMPDFIHDEAGRLTELHYD
ncbi:MAG: hypothetical protein RR146_03525, partial [Lachnospiraceae bacterium]